MAIALHADVYVPGHSPIHQWAVRPKLISLLVLMFAIALVKHLALIPWVLGAVAVLYGLSQLPLSYLQSRLPYPGLFIVSMVILLPWISGETVLWQGGGLALRQEGLQAALLIAGRFLAIVITGFILLGTTPFLSILQALRSFGLPTLLTDMTLLTYRYLFDIAAQLVTMQQAMKLRGHGLLRQTVQRQWGWLVALFGSLLLRSYERSHRIYKAMRLRGYGQGVANGKPISINRQSSAPGQLGHGNRPSDGGQVTPWATALTLLVALGLVFAEWNLSGL